MSYVDYINKQVDTLLKGGLISLSLRKHILYELLPYIQAECDRRKIEEELANG